ncbi:MAG: AAA family ATPase [Sulfuricellaceae bacterium]|nr:AAA family ATPase [Sulfuricellaceae bacterium]
MVTLLGPRQSGKTTLARMAFPDKPWVSLEDPDVRMAAEADPRGFLGQWGDGAVLDEIQRLPSLLSYLQGLVDRESGRGRFILTGSHQPRLQEAISQSLAGRTAVLTLWPFSLHELRHYFPLLNPFELISARQTSPFRAGSRTRTPEVSFTVVSAAFAAALCIGE